MANITKTDAVELIATQALSASTVLKSPELDVSTKLAATIFVAFGRYTIGTPAAAANIRIEGTPDASGDRRWRPLVSLASGITAAVSEAIVTAAADQNVLLVASTTGFVVGDTVLCSDAGTPANSQFGRVKAISANVSITLEDNLTNAMTGKEVYDQADIFPPVLIDCLALKRLRVIVDAAGHDVASMVEAYAVTGDSIG